MYKLSELNQASFAAQHPVALDNGRPIDWGQLSADITATRSLVRDPNVANWALFHVDTYKFAVGLLALLAENKTVYLPGENHAGVTADLVSQGINLIGQFHGSPCQDIFPAQQTGPTDDYTLGGTIVVYTSGSTGAAKPIVKTLAQLDRELLTLESIWGRSWNDPVITGTVSHQHFYGLLFSLLWPLCSGRRFCCKPFIDPAIMANTTSGFEQTVWVMSPAHLHRMPGNIPWESARGGVSAVFSSGGPLQQQAAQNIYERLGHYPVEVLGSSETGGIASRQQKESATPWQPLPGVDIRLDRSGALVVRSPWLENENWYVTSDLATLSPGRTFQLGMRADRIVKLEGKRVALPEVEAALIKHPWVGEAAVVVVARQRESLAAVLALTEVGRSAEAEKGRHLFSRELRQFLRQRVSTAAIPRLWRVTPALPRNAQGKILEQTMKGLFNQPPLPDLIKRVDTENGCLLGLSVDSDNPYFEGHFPDHPVLAGIVQLLWAQHFGKEFLPIRGEFSGMKTIKFRELVFPGRTLSLKLEYAQESGRLKFYYDSSDGRHSQGILLFEVRT